ncbi:TetR/AcrR family transcriptional regulator [Novosphingobium bradum]|uniref:TetR/AcrR family transcriptional regulator n=1 Tax=Novosphingobium bradum TaxID=1737444 RepID=A0ABV7ILK6_9SPHN
MTQLPSSEPARAAARPVRRSQARRTADTRLALVEAAIRLLCRVGYAGTTTLAIPEEAGLSRGAFQHQFGTKAALMIEVVKHVYAEELLEYRRYFNGKPNLDLSDFPAVIWEISRRPSAIAVLEILNGCRNDPQLAEQLMPIQDEIERNSIENLMGALRINQAAPVAIDMEAAKHAVRLIVWSARGLSIMMGMGKSQAELAGSVALLESLLRSGQGEWMRVHGAPVPA